MKKDFLERFLPNEINRWLFPMFISFCVAGFGVAMGFLSDYIENKELRIASFIITVLGVFVCFVVILFKLYSLTTKHGLESLNHECNKQNERVKQPWE